MSAAHELEPIIRTANTASSHEAIVDAGMEISRDSKLLVEWCKAHSDSLPEGKVRLVVPQNKGTVQVQIDNRIDGGGFAIVETPDRVTRDQFVMGVVGFGGTSAETPPLSVTFGVPATDGWEKTTTFFPLNSLPITETSQKSGQIKAPSMVADPEYSTSAASPTPFDQLTSQHKALIDAVGAAGLPVDAIGLTPPGVPPAPEA